MIDMSKMFNMQAMMFSMMLVGFVLRKKSVITKEVQQGMSSLLIDVILPCNIFYAFLQSDSSLLKKMMVMVAIAVTLQVLWFTISRIAWRNKEPGRRAVLRYGLQFSNAGALGNPIVEELYGPEGLAYASVYLVPARIFMWTIGVACFTDADKKSLGKLATHPCIVAAAVGILWMVFPVGLPTFLTNTISGFSKCLAPVSMVLIGAALSEAHLKDIFCKDVYMLTCLRLIVQPVLTLLVCWLLHIDMLIGHVATVLVGMPVASSAVVLATRYHKEAGFASGVLAFSMILSLVTIPLLSLLADALYLYH